MTNSCAKCDSPITGGRKLGISCDGFCGNSFHLACINLSADVLKYKGQPGCLWFCQGCLDLRNEGSVYRDLVQQSIQGVLQKLENAFSVMKSELIDTVNAKFNCTTNITVPSYSDVAKNIQKSLIIKPKNEKQAVSITKLQVLENLKQSATTVPITKVKHINSGGILVTCGSDDGSLKLKKVVDENLSQNYNISEVSNPKPRIKIVGICSEVTKEEIIRFLKLQNPDKFKEESECVLLKFWSTKKKSNIMQALVQVDCVTYRHIMMAEDKFVIVGLDRCRIYDGIELLRCYKCSNFNHSASVCKAKFACPRCSMEHELTDCKDEYSTKCINCFNYKNLHLKSNENLDIDCNHTAMDKNNCFVYKLKIKSLKSSILGLQ